MMDQFFPGLTLDFYLNPLNFQTLYPSAVTIEQMLEGFADDLDVIASQLATFPSVRGVGGGVYTQRIDGVGTVRVVGELMIDEDPGFHQELFDAKLDLMLEGFMYYPATNKWVAAGIVE